MRLKKKVKATPTNKNSNIEEELEILKVRLREELKLLHEQEDIVFAVKRHIFDLENAPFMDGDTVIMDIQVGAKVRQYTCVLSVELTQLGEYRFRATPVKEDGTIFNKGYWVYDKSQIRYAH